MRTIVVTFIIVVTLFAFFQNLNVPPTRLVTKRIHCGDLVPTPPPPAPTPSPAKTNVIAVLVSGQQNRLDVLTVANFGTLLASLKANCKCQIHVYYNLVRREDGVQVTMFGHENTNFGLPEKTREEMREINAAIDEAMASAGVELISNTFEEDHAQMEYNKRFGDGTFEAATSKSFNAYAFASQFVNTMRGYRDIQRFEAEQGYVTLALSFTHNHIQVQLFCYHSDTIRQLLLHACGQQSIRNGKPCLSESFVHQQQMQLWRLQRQISPHGTTTCSSFLHYSEWTRQSSPIAYESRVQY